MLTMIVRDQSHSMISKMTHAQTALVAHHLVTVVHRIAHLNVVVLKLNAQDAKMLEYAQCFLKNVKNVLVAPIQIHFVILHALIQPYVAYMELFVMDVLDAAMHQILAIVVLVMFTAHTHSGIYTVIKETVHVVPLLMLALIVLMLLFAIVTQSSATMVLVQSAKVLMIQSKMMMKVEKGQWVDCWKRLKC